MAATSQQLADASACLDRCIPDGMKWAAIIYQLGRISGVTNPTTIMAGATCYDRCIPQGAKLAAIIFLLDSIATAGSGGTITCGTGAPVAAPSGSCGIYVDTTAGAEAIYVWSGTAWVLKV